MLKSAANLFLPGGMTRLLKKSKRSLSRTMDLIYYMMAKNQLSKMRIPLVNSHNNVLFIVRDMSVGGVTRVNLDIIEGMRQGPCRFHVAATSRTSGPWHEKFEECCESLIIPKRTITDIGVWGKYFCYIVGKLNIGTVVISNSYVGYHALPYLKSMFPSLKTMDILHAKEMWGASEPSRWAIPYLDKRILISKTLRYHLEKQYASSGVAPGYAERLNVIYNGIDPAQYGQAATITGLNFKSSLGLSADTRIIAFIGRFSREKRPCLFVKIANGLMKRRQAEKLRFVMAGDGEAMVEVKKTIKKFRMEDNFILTGMIDARKVVELLADTYLLLMTSSNEGVPLTMFEAMLMKVPVIASDVGAVHEIIEDRFNGCLVRPGGSLVRSYANTVFDFLSGRLDHSAMAERAREKIVSEYSMDRMIQGYREAFRQLHSTDMEAKKTGLQGTTCF